MEKKQYERKCEEIDKMLEKAIKERDELQEQLQFEIHEKSSLSEAIEQLETKLAELEQTNANLQSIILPYEPTYDEAVKMREHWVNECRLLLDEQKSAREERDRVDLTRQDLYEKEREIQSRETELNEERNQMFQNEEEHKAKIDELQCLLNKSEEALTNVRTLLNQRNQEVSAYQTNLNAATERNNTLQTNLAEREATIQNCEQELSRLNGLCAQLKNTELHLREENAALVDEKLRKSSRMLNDRETIGIF